MSELHYLYGQPTSTADLRTHNSDFQVQEILPFAPTGEGEHHLLHIRKEGLNTVEVAKMLSSFAHVHPKEVTYAGQKDKHAITEQWFGVRIPGKETPDWQELDSEQITVLSASRHSKKLRIGALAGNRFTLTLRNVSDMSDVVERIEKMSEQGVPNYFGEQRFGHDGKNLMFGRQMFTGRKVKDRNKRSMYLSAVRSNLFNLACSARLSAHGVAPLEGDCVLLAGSKSYFVAENWDETLLERLAKKDIQLSAPLWGRGTPLAQGDAATCEAEALASLMVDREGLEQAGLNQERRALLLEPQHLQYQVDEGTITLKFALPSGSYATSVLRELFQYQDVQEVARKQMLAAQNAAGAQ
ncbi:tRNA pseudouridine(13) synthase TruD [Shewanella schlegeliana]|uniref:tRNA pseudouridine synthase D n=1 Tax=Shewanella schlegeliana TaxID=190308 RepID=A0ABS1T0R0_9GAMM|nr:tRNA pseudouridine(13) synthase TruD [Shewanella schlegeliana]MBL4914170.1 tRNA pseudouridine(13) synthase TruD [Shewanella schlegeliana]MCL1111436.1 tRNA pseudouridine(13) synthase TruD [Shewanella schlegeliana]GIU33768.1 tRNA pseudouridine synthase D [Shewanella schlegeliana]